MPNPYTPPIAPRVQAVKSARGRFRQRLRDVQPTRRWRAWWLIPLLGLLPIVVAVVLASDGRFGAAGGQPVATGQVATSATVGGQPAAATQPAQGAPAAQPTASAASVASGPATQAVPGQPAQSVAGGTSPSQVAVAGVTSNGPGAGGSQAGSGAPIQGASTAAATGPFRAYAVQPGDTVKFVAQLYGVSPASISQASGLLNPDYVRVGQVLTIPNQPGWLYRVQPGESLDQIATRTGVPTEIILSASKLATDSVRPGDVILIPDQAAAISK